MIHLLPLLRLPLWLRRPRTGPVPVAETSTAPAPPWEHRPPAPPIRAELCGHCAEPIGESPDGEFCRPEHAALWLAAQGAPIASACPVKILPTREPTPRAEPSWLVAWSEWEQKKAQAVIEARKVPAVPYVPGSAAKKVAEAMADAEPIHPLTPAPGDVANAQRASDDAIQQASAIEGEAA